MVRLGLKILMGSGAKYYALLFGVYFTAFLVTFASSFFCGMMTRGFALIAENPSADVWVMDPAVVSPERTINLSPGSLDRVRSVEGVAWASPLMLASTDIRFPDGRFQPVQIIGVDNVTLAGMPVMEDDTPRDDLRSPDAAAVAGGVTEGRLQTSLSRSDAWLNSCPPPADAEHLLAAGDKIVANDARVRVVGRAAALPRFPFPAAPLEGPLPVALKPLPGCVPGTPRRSRPIPSGGISTTPKTSAM